MNALVSIRRTIGILAAAAAFCLLPGAQAAEEGMALDHFPLGKLTNLPSLQDGAKTFVNYCLSCHSASMMRYNRLRDIGLTEDQIANNLIFTGQKVGDLMTVAMRGEDAKEWFDNTMAYLTDRYPELSPEKLHELRTLGERFAQPPKRQTTTAA